MRPSAIQVCKSVREYSVDCAKALSSRSPCNSGLMRTTTSSSSSLSLSAIALLYFFYELRGIFLLVNIAEHDKAVLNFRVFDVLGKILDRFFVIARAVASRSGQTNVHER